MHHIHSPDSPSETTFSVKPQWYYLTAFCIWQQQTVMAILLIVLLPLYDAGGGGGIRTHGAFTPHKFSRLGCYDRFSTPPWWKDLYLLKHLSLDGAGLPVTARAQRVSLNVSYFGCWVTCVWIKISATLPYLRSTKFYFISLALIRCLWRGGRDLNPRTPKDRFLSRELV